MANLSENSRSAVALGTVSTSGSDIQGSIRRSIKNPRRSHDERLRRDIHFYRFKYVCNLSCFTFCKSIKRRIPTGINVFIVLIMLGLEQVAYNGAVEFIIAPFLTAANLKSGLRPLVRVVGLKLIVDLLFPVTGWLADVWVGQYRMIHLSSWIMWFGYSIAALAISLESRIYWSNYLLLPCYLAINIGSAAFQANAIPFGADQIPYKTSYELSSYFYMYYWIRNLGAATFLMAVTCGSFRDTTQSLTYVGIGIVSITAILVFHALFKDGFEIDKKKFNPLSTIFKVTRLSVTIKRPIHRSAFSYTGASQPSRLDLTMMIHGGMYDEETVEDVKTFLRLVTILLPLLIILVVYTGVISVMDLQVQSFSGNFTFYNSTCYFSPSTAYGFNLISILILTPVINSCVLPYLREYAPTMLLKIGIGMVVMIMGIISMFGLEVTSYIKFNHGGSQLKCFFDGSSSFQEDNLLSVWWLVLPYSLVSLAEILINISSIEFFYAQSPHTMRGMMVGLFFFIWGSASSITQLLVTLFEKVDINQVLSCGFWYYIILLIVAILGLAIYIKIFLKYKNRQRGEILPEKYYRQGY